MSGKGFTAPARSLASRMPKEEDGLSYISQLLKSMGGSSDDKPTVFAENGISPFRGDVNRLMENFGRQQEIQAQRTTEGKAVSPFNQFRQYLFGSGEDAAQKIADRREEFQSRVEAEDAARAAGQNVPPARTAQAAVPPCWIRPSGSSPCFDRVAKERPKHGDK